MQSLIQASRDQAVANLIEQYYDIPQVQGFALGVHGNYISLYRGRHGRSMSLREILDEDKPVPSWDAVCQNNGFASGLSAIFVVIYVAMPAVDFLANFRPPATIGTNTGVFVEEIEPYRGFADRIRHRPKIMGGISLSNELAPAAGTLGGFLQDASRADTFALSCSHVLWDPASSDVLQQGSSDGGASPIDSISNKLFNVPLISGTGFSYGSPYNSVDAAIAELNSTVSAIRNVRLLGAVTSTLANSNVSLGDDVVFVGKESDYQDCHVFRFIARQKVDIAGTLYNFGDIFEIESRLPIYVGSLSRDGDSGSWVVRETNGFVGELCGMLFAGNTTGPNRGRALCCFIENVFNELSSITGFPLVLL